ncbi:hypothetical protein D9756_008376 [Leucocoprinus leucothites]|uniref:Nephrocystin 3-like N-terminal domain-containing protein n=1 Tax=Leucocoprinus leucothites TaxID=201217 RepID=A0A8H5FVZ9_9AGAR|nr:hypothetical protein D9756_008376 [Leucoagaricus leucothites]
MFSGAHDFVINQLTVAVFGKKPDFSKGAGLRELLDKSMPNAFLDSSARWPPPKCHNSTRKDLFGTIANWEIHTSDHARSMLWLHGPFGVGKSAVAQTLSERLAAENKLRASLFLSRSNNRSDPNCIITSIAYQLAIQFPPLGDLLDHEIQDEPSLVTASLPVQFRKLVEEPLRHIVSNDSGIEGWIVVDGLDEIEGIEAQKEIIRLITTSIKEKTTPFLWFITSRPDPHIVRCMNASTVSPLLFRIPLQPSPKGDSDILLYLTEELERIREFHNLPSSWLSKADIENLAVFTEGLWICAAALIHFVGDPNTLGPIAQLRVALALTKRSPDVQNHPLAAMNMLYTVVMQRVPPRMISMVQKILLLNRVYSRPSINKVLEITNVLKLSREKFRSACAFLHSVLYLDSEESPTDIIFYHTSFMDFMEDPESSGCFCIYGDCLEELQQEVIGRINVVHRCSGRNLFSAINVTFPQTSQTRVDDLALVYHSLIDALLKLCDSDNCAISPSVAVSLLNVQFPMIPIILNQLDSRFRKASLRLNKFRENLPPEFRNKILQTVWNPLDYFPRPLYTYVGRLPKRLGGRYKLVVWLSADQSSTDQPVLAVAECGYYSPNFSTLCRCTPHPVHYISWLLGSYFYGWYDFYFTVVEVITCQTAFIIDCLSPRWRRIILFCMNLYGSKRGQFYVTCRPIILIKSLVSPTLSPVHYTISPLRDVFKHLRALCPVIEDGIRPGPLVADIFKRHQVFRFVATPNLSASEVFNIYSFVHFLLIAGIYKSFISCRFLFLNFLLSCFVAHLLHSAVKGVSDPSLIPIDIRRLARLRDDLRGVVPTSQEAQLVEGTIDEMQDIEDEHEQQGKSSPFDGLMTYVFFTGLTIVIGGWLIAVGRTITKCAIAPVKWAILVAKFGIKLIRRATTSLRN